MFKEIKELLEPGWITKFKSERSKGHMGQTEIRVYEVYDEHNNLIGEIEHTSSTQIRGLTTRNNARWLSKTSGHPKT